MPFGWLVYLLWFWFYDSQVKTALFESLDWVRWFTRRRPQHFVSQLCAQRTRITLPTSVKLLKQTTMRDLMRSANIGEEESWDRNLRQPSLSLKRPRSRRWKSNLYKLLPECNKICAVKSLQIFCVFFFDFSKNSVSGIAICCVLLGHSS